MVIEMGVRGLSGHWMAALRVQVAFPLVGHRLLLRSHHTMERSKAL